MKSYLKSAEDKFNEADEKLKELGSILFHASITADIIIPPVNGEGFVSKQVNGEFSKWTGIGYLIKKPSRFRRDGCTKQKTKFVIELLFYL